MTINRIEVTPLFVDFDIPNPEKGLEKEQSFYVYSKHLSTDQKVAFFNLSPLPGCCGVVVSHSSIIYPDSRIYNYGKAFHALKEQVARHFGYSLMIATTLVKNLPEVIGAAKAGWRHEKIFNNKRTRNDLTLMVKELK